MNRLYSSIIKSIVIFFMILSINVAVTEMGYTQDGKGWDITEVKYSFSNSYSETDEYHQTLSFSPNENERIMILDFKIRASVDDPQAVKYLNTKLDELHDILKDETVYSFLPVSRPSGLKGKFKCFDLNNFSLKNTSGKTYSALWAAKPKSERLYFAGSDQLLAGRRPKPSNWENTVRYNNFFVGLLDVGNTVEVSLIYSIPKTLEPNNLLLDIEGGKKIKLGSSD